MQLIGVLNGELTMPKPDIHDLPVLEFDAGVADTRWGETTTSAVTVIIASIIAMLT